MLVDVIIEKISRFVGGIIGYLFVAALFLGTIAGLIWIIAASWDFLFITDWYVSSKHDYGFNCKSLFIYSEDWFGNRDRSEVCVSREIFDTIQIGDEFND